LTKLFTLFILFALTLSSACNQGNKISSDMRSAPTISSALMPDKSSNDPIPSQTRPATRVSTQTADQNVLPAAWISPTSIVLRLKTPTVTLRVNTATVQPAVTNTSVSKITPTATGLPAGRVHESGEIQKSPVDGAFLIYIPAGLFLQGASTTDTFAQANEKPQHAVTLNAFWIDQNKVTNKMYRTCEMDHGCSTPQKIPWPVLGDAKGYYTNSAFDDYPVVNVTWDQAYTYCSWAGRRLPTEAEWEKAARGTDGRLYPWGSATPDNKHLNFATHVSHTSQVGKYPDGVSPYGVMEMVGNTFEWVSDFYDALYYSYSPPSNPTGPVISGSNTRVIRGISWGVDNHLARVTSRSGKWNLSFDEQTGFRCAGNSNVSVEPLVAP
jgi:formylglycine-generating enzyme required for sulfatase activity